MNGNVEIGDMHVALFVKEDVIQFNVPTQLSATFFPNRASRSPMHNLLAMQIIQRQGQFTHPEPDCILGYRSLTIQMNCHGKISTAVAGHEEATHIAGHRRA